jgi:glucan phosphoethanolaminetransferase (alkaline phosphatase superfamily)
MENKKRTLTKNKVIRSLIATLLIIFIAVYLIIDKQANNVQDMWQELILIGLALVMSMSIVFAYRKSKN